MRRLEAGGWRLEAGGWRLAVLGGAERQEKRKGFGLRVCRSGRGEAEEGWGESIRAEAVSDFRTPFDMLL